MDITFTNETVINLPRDKMVELYVDPQYQSKWQKNFISYKLLSDESKGELEMAEVTYRLGENTFTFVRKVLKSDLPNMNVATFEIDGIRQIVENQFVVISDNQTKLISTVTISSVNERLQANFEQVTSAFESQTVSMQSDFKKFAEAF